MVGVISIMFALIGIFCFLVSQPMPFQQPFMDDTIQESMQFIGSEYDYVTLVAYWDYGIIYDSMSNKTAIFKSHPDLRLTNFSKAMLTENESASIELLKSISPGHSLLILSTDDIKKISVIERLSNATYTNDSILHRGLFGSLSIYESVYCNQGISQKICIYKIPGGE